MSGRPPIRAPEGRVSLSEAAERSGLTYAEVHRRVTTGRIPAQRDGGSWTILIEDVRKLRRRKPAGDTRKAYMVRPRVERAKAWEAKAKRNGQSVGVWLMGLADRDSGWSEPE